MKNLRKAVFTTGLLFSANVFGGGTAAYTPTAQSPSQAFLATSQFGYAPGTTPGDFDPFAQIAGFALSGMQPGTSASNAGVARSVTAASPVSASAPAPSPAVSTTRGVAPAPAVPTSRDVPTARTPAEQTARRLQSPAPWTRNQSTMNDQVADEQAPSCQQPPADVNMWNSTKSVAGNVIGKGTGYDIKLDVNEIWPEMVMNGDKVEVKYPPNTDSHCTIGTTAAFMKHLADLHNSGSIRLEPRHLEFISSKDGPMKHALNGDTFSMALLYQYLGGKSVSNKRVANKTDIMAALNEARPGDVLKISRKKNSRGQYTGHSTIFKSLKKGKKGMQICYMTSSTRNDDGSEGYGEKCEPVDRLNYVAISRLPEDVCSIPAKLDAMMKNPEFAERFQYIHKKKTEKAIQPSWIAWGPLGNKSTLATGAQTTGVQ